MTELKTFLGRMFDKVNRAPKSPHRTLTTFLSQYDNVVSSCVGVTIDIKYVNPDYDYSVDCGNDIVFTNAFKSMVANWLVGNAIDKPAYISIGRGTTTDEPEELTALVDPFDTQPVSASEGNVVESYAPRVYSVFVCKSFVFTTSFSPAGRSSSDPIREIGLLDSENVLLARMQSETPYWSFPDVHIDPFTVEISITLGVT